ISGWENCIRSLHSEENYDIYISGSNSNLLSSELSTYLTGRFIEFKIYPLSFKEFLTFRGSDNIKEEFENYIKYGGLPAIHKMNFEDEIIYSYLGGVFSTIIFKDIINRYSIRNSNLLLDIMKFLSDNIGNIFSAKKISDYLKNQKISISVDTLREYLQYFENTFLLSKVHRFDIRGKNLLEIYEKYYLNDIGFRSYLLGFRQNNIGQILENIVYNELLVRGYNIKIGKIGNLEIDFIAEKNGERKYIQVTYLLASQDVIDREFTPLLKVGDNYEKIVLSLDEFFAKDFQGIKRLNIIDWLMNN
ncbi:MAG: ATP-binding protein, partial [Candidatus Gracilibacteria bacterium]|nr:ATP-binding protein [Candidatus Gracilibacteria bacterium]